MVRKLTIKMFFLIFLVLSFVACTKVEEKLKDIGQGQRAVAVLHPAGNDKISGVATFIKELHGVKIIVDVYGLESGNHGLHLHKYGSLQALDSARARIIFDPLDQPHGGPDKRNHKLGDWGNLTADQDGHAVKEWVDIDLTFTGSFGIIGRSVVIHKNEDDMLSQPDGNVGPILASGTIGWAKPQESGY
jgi:Cu-Zn family superoxide dismutase